MIWTEEQKHYLNLLEIPIWVSREVVSDALETNVQEQTHIQHDRSNNITENPQTIDHSPALTQNSQSQTQAPKQDLSTQAAKAAIFKEALPESTDSEKANPPTAINANITETDTIDAKPLACLVFKTPSFLLVIEQTWNQIKLTQAEQVFIKDLLIALYQDPNDAFQSANSFQWPPTNNEMFLVEDSMLAFNEYFSEFPHHLFIIFGSSLHKALDEQVELWNLSEIADTQVMNLPPLTEFIGNSSYKKRLWKNFLAPLAPAFK